MTRPLTHRHLPYDTAAQVRALVNDFDQAAAAERTRVMTDNSIVDKTPATADALGHVRELYAARLGLITTNLDNQYQAIRDASMAAQPAPGTGVEALLTRQAWWARTRELLNAGVPIGSVIAQATDPEQLHSLVEELPTAAQTGVITGDPDRVEALLTRRLAQLAGPDAVQALDDLGDAAASLDVLRPILAEAAHHIGATDYRSASDEDFADALAQYGLKPRR
jgi:hypothetical protein